MTWSVMTPVLPARGASTQPAVGVVGSVMASPYPVRVSQHGGASVMTSGFGTPGEPLADPIRPMNDSNRTSALVQSHEAPRTPLGDHNE